MKASELIRELAEMKAKHGDVEVLFSPEGGGTTPVNDVARCLSKTGSIILLTQWAARFKIEKGMDLGSGESVTVKNEFDLENGSISLIKSTTLKPP